MPDPLKILLDSLKFLPDFKQIRYVPVGVSFVAAEMGLADFRTWVSRSKEGKHRTKVVLIGIVSFKCLVSLKDGDFHRRKALKFRGNVAVFGGFKHILTAKKT